MKYAKRIVSLLLLLSITAGSTAALAAEDIHVTVNASQSSDSASTITNPSPKITVVDSMYGESQSEGIQLWTNFHRTAKDINSGSFYYRPSVGEFPVMYRSVNYGKFNDIYEQTTTVWASFYAEDSDLSHDPKDDVILVQDNKMKNGNYYEYKLATMFRESEDQEPITIACSKPVSVYYLKSMYSSRIRLRNSASGKTIKLSWNEARNTKADGYQLYYVHKTKSNRWSKPITRKVKGNKTIHITLKNRTPGKDYRFQIRSYKKYQGKTYYGNYSDYIFRY